VPTGWRAIFHEELLTGERVSNNETNLARGGLVVAGVASVWKLCKSLCDDLFRFGRKTDNFVQSLPSSRLLGRNLGAAGVMRPPNSAAHHIVAGGAPGAAEARSVLSRFGIDINAAENGVFLPLNTKVADRAAASVHATLHTNAYYATVNDVLGQATSQSDALAALGVIRAQLLSGGFP
jgi:hypothetical protein